MGFLMMRWRSSYSAIAIVLAACEPLVIQGDAGPDAGIDAGMVETRTLELTVAGDGVGRVVSSPEGIDCGQSCTASFALGEMVVVTASAARESRFVSWSAPCGGELWCEVWLDGDLQVSATFGRSRYDLTIEMEGEGEGRVVTERLECTESCSQSYSADHRITLFATPRRSSSFAGWSGDGCSGSLATCDISMGRMRTVTARFDAPGQLRRFRTIEDLGVSAGA